MENIDFDPRKYGELLAHFRPAIIDDPEDHERLLTAAEGLMDKGESLSNEERKVLELLVLLVEIFEHEVAESEEMEPPQPHETLQRLLEGRGWQPAALNDIFGNPSLVAEVLAGAKPISKGQAKSLGKMFRVPPKLFLK